MMRRWLFALAFCSVAACGDSTPPAAPADSSVANGDVVVTDIGDVSATDAVATDAVATDAVASDIASPDAPTSDAITPDAATDVAIADATADAGRLVGCLDQPADLLRPPEGVLPCELVPPGL